MDNDITIDFSTASALRKLYFLKDFKWPIHKNNIIAMDGTVYQHLMLFCINSLEKEILWCFYVPSYNKIYIKAKLLCELYKYASVTETSHYKHVRGL